MCRLDRNRAGVALYVRNTIITKHRQDLSQPNIKMLWSELAFKNYKVLIGVCYRPPNGIANDIELFIIGLENVFNLIVGHSKIIVVFLGDFIDRCKSWIDDHSTSELGHKLVNLPDHFNLSQLVYKPTRNENILDLIITDSPVFFTDADILDL